MAQVSQKWNDGLKRLVVPGLAVASVMVGCDTDTALDPDPAQLVDDLPHNQ
jgi:hypothetical protein